MGSTTYTLLTPSPLSFSPGETCKYIAINVNNDSLIENDETVIFTLSTSITNGTRNSAAYTATYTIVDDEPPPVVSISGDSSGLESVTSKLVTVTLSAPSVRTVTIPFSVNTGSSAKAGADYTISASPLSFTPGTTSRNITLTIVNDTIDEPDEQVIIDLGTPTNAVLGSLTSSTYTILDNDNPPVVSIAASSSGGENVASKNIAVTFSNASVTTISVPLLIGGTATGGGVDYTLSSPNPLIFAPGDTTKNVTLSIVDDPFDEANETVVVEIGSSLVNATRSSSAYVSTYTISDNDAAPSVSIEASSLGSENVTSKTLAVTLSAPSNLSVSVPFSLSGTATGGGTDYTLQTPSPLSFAPGEISKYLSVAINNDTLIENDETIIFTLSGSITNGTRSSTAYSATYTIVDDELPPVVSITGSSSGLENVSSKILTVSLSSPSARTISIPFTVSSDSTAKATVDYAITASPLVFSPGVVSKNINLSIINDSIDEPDEQIVIDLGNPTNAALGETTRTIYTIIDNDNPPRVSFAAATSSCVEGTTGTVLPVSLSGISGWSPLSVNYTVTGTASGGGVDHTLSSGTLVFAEGETTTSLPIAFDTIDDQLDENDETVIVTLIPNAGAASGTVMQHTCTIIDNDDPPIVAINGNMRAWEYEGRKKIGISLSSPSGKDISIPFSVGGTAISSGKGKDYSLDAVSPILLPAGTTMTTLTLSMVDDDRQESDETVTIDLGTPTNAIMDSGHSKHVFTIKNDDFTPNNPPVVTFSVESPTMKALEPIRFDASASYDPETTIKAYHWDMGDGTTADGTSTLTHSFASEGLYLVALTLTDDDGTTASSSLICSVNPRNVVPTAVAQVDCIDGLAPLTAHFDASSSKDPDGTIVSYHWTFGDGGAGAGMATSHTYTVNGTYAVNLTVTDDNNASTTTQQTVMVGNHYPTNLSLITEERMDLENLPGEAGNGKMGTAVDLNGQYAIVGAPYFDGDSTRTGTAYVFKRDDNTHIWGRQAVLPSPSPEPGEYQGYGRSVCIQDGLVAVGAPYLPGEYEFSGAVFIYRQVGDTWVLDQKLTAPDEVEGAWFGESLAISGNTLVVGADGTSESAYVFVREDSTWRFSQRLVPSDAGTRSLLGTSVAVQGDTLVVGAPSGIRTSTQVGAVYVFKRQEGNWVQQAKVVDPYGGLNNEFGFSVAISGLDIVIGAPGTYYNGDDAGSVFVYSWNGTNWEQKAGMGSATGSPGARFGCSVDMEGLNLFSGAKYQDSMSSSFSDEGTFHLLRKNGSTWVDMAHRFPSIDNSNAYYGESIAVSSNTLIVGSPGTIRNLVNTGSVFMYRINDSEITIEDNAPQGTLLATLACNDADNQALTFSLLQDPSGDLKVTKDNGTWNLRVKDGATIQSSVMSRFTIRIRVQDSQGARLEKDILVYVTNSSRPTAQSQALVTSEDTPVSITLVASDPNGIPLVYRIVKAPSRGQLTGTAPFLLYTPRQDSNGTDTFVFAASNGQQESYPKTVTISINPVNDAPVFSSDITLTPDRPMLPRVLKLSTWAEDVDHNPLVYTWSAVSDSSATAVFTPNGTSNSKTTSAVFDSDGTFTLQVSVSDGTTVSNMVKRVFVHEFPVAYDQVLEIPQESTNCSITLSASSLGGYNLTYSLVQMPLQGTLAGNPSSGTLVYTPTPVSFAGVDSFSFKVNDGLADSNIARIVLIRPVSGENPGAPVASDFVLETEKETSVSASVSPYVTDDGAFSLVAIGQPEHGQVFADPGHNTLTYLPDADYVGEDSFLYTVSDLYGALASARVMIKVIGYHVDLSDATMEQHSPKGMLAAPIKCYPSTLGARLKVARVFQVLDDYSTVSLPLSTFIIQYLHDKEDRWGLVWNTYNDFDPNVIKAFGVDIKLEDVQTTSAASAVAGTQSARMGNEMESAGSGPGKSRRAQGVRTLGTEPGREESSYFLTEKQPDNRVAFRLYIDDDYYEKNWWMNYGPAVFSVGGYSVVAQHMAGIASPFFKLESGQILDMSLSAPSNFLGENIVHGISRGFYPSEEQWWCRMSWVAGEGFVIHDPVYSYYEPQKPYWSVAQGGLGKRALGIDIGQKEAFWENHTAKMYVTKISLLDGDKAPRKDSEMEVYRPEAGETDDKSKWTKIVVPKLPLIDAMVQAGIQAPSGVYPQSVPSVHIAQEGSGEVEVYLDDKETLVCGGNARDREYSLFNLLKEGDVTLYVKGVRSGNVTLIDEFWVGEFIPEWGGDVSQVASSDFLKCTVPETVDFVTDVDLIADSDHDGVIDKDKDNVGEGKDPGALVLLNRDDDNGDQKADNGDGAFVSTDDDLAPLKICCADMAALQAKTVKIYLSQSCNPDDGGKVRVFDKNGSILLDPNDADGSADLSALFDAQGNLDLTMEGYKVGALTLKVEADTNGRIECDEVKVTVFDVELRDIAAKNPVITLSPVTAKEKTDLKDVAFISGEPQMPQLEVRIIPPLELADTSVKWDLKINYSRDEFNKKAGFNNCSIRNDDVEYKAEVKAGEIWRIHDSRSVPDARELKPGSFPHPLMKESHLYDEIFCGGNRTTLSWELFGFKKQEAFRILGKNPNNMSTRTYMSKSENCGKFWYAWAIAKEETAGSCFYNQFNTSGGSKFCPDWGGPAGWGIFQIDRCSDCEKDSKDHPIPDLKTDKRYAPVNELWNWKENFAYGIKELEGKNALYWDIITDLAIAFPDLPWAQLQPSGYKVDDELTLTPEEVYTIVAYNGLAPKTKVATDSEGNKVYDENGNEKRVVDGFNFRIQIPKMKNANPVLNKDGQFVMKTMRSCWALNCPDSAKSRIELPELEWKTKDVSADPQPNAQNYLFKVTEFLKKRKEDEKDDKDDDSSK